MLAAAALAFGLFHCGKPRQAQPPKIEDTGDRDMPAEPKPAEATTAAASAAPAVDPERKAECCGFCKDNLAKDRTGQKPEVIPCSDLMADANPWCLSFFRKTPLMASECQ